jgi:uncharacterized membrane protein YfcA
MSWGAIVAMVGLGVGAGVVGGMFGIGGGLIIVPALVLGFGFDQKTATGTSLLAQLLPVAFLAVREFWRRGEVDVSRGLGIAAGLVFGSLLGAIFAGLLSPAAMKRAYGAFLIVVGLYFVIGTKTTPTPANPVAPATVDE